MVLCCYPVHLTAQDNTNKYSAMYWCCTLAARKCFLAYGLQKGMEGRRRKETLYITDTDWQDKWLLSISLVTATNLVLSKTKLLHTALWMCFPTFIYMSIWTLWDNYISIFFLKLSHWVSFFNCMLLFTHQPNSVGWWYSGIAFWSTQ